MREIEDFWDGLISESRRAEKDFPFKQVKESRLKKAAAAKIGRPTRH